MSTPSRRQFLVASLGATGAMVVSCQRLKFWQKEAELPDAGVRLSPWLAIDRDGAVTVTVSEAEMGQGVYTALPMIVVEELGAAWESVRVIPAPAHRRTFGYQLTASSTSVRDNYQTLRQVGAAARTVLIEEGAARLDVGAAECIARGGRVTHATSGKSLAFGELVAGAAKRSLPQEPVLRSDPPWLIGTSPPRLDIPDKVFGRAQYGIDVRQPGMRFASVARSPWKGAMAKAGGGLLPEGVQRVPLSGGVAFVGPDSWTAAEARRKAAIEWVGGDRGLDASQIGAAVQSAKKRTSLAFRRGVSEPHSANLKSGSPPASLTASYDVPYLAHATMEPMNCTAWVRDGKCEIWAPTQAPTHGQKMVGRALGIDRDDVEIHTTLLGGGFGRRANTDFIVEAVELANKVSGPIQVLWSREDDTRGQSYRPCASHELRASLAQDGTIRDWKHTVVAPPIGKLDEKGVSPTAVEGAVDLPYTVPNVEVRYGAVDLPVEVGFWRSVGHSHTAFAVESFMDRLAKEAGADPLDFRLSMLGNSPRHRRALMRVGEMSRWGSPGLGSLGLAVHESFGSVVAIVLQVQLADSQKAKGVSAGVGWKVTKAWCAVDCGAVIHPDIVQSQLEGSIVFGLSAARFGKISFSGGQVQQSNFHDYPLIRMPEAPPTEIAILSRDPAKNEAGLGGVGEPGVPPVAPALANAVFRLLGVQPSTLPMG